MPKPPVQVSLTWDRDLAFKVGAANGLETIVDGDSRRGLSPVQMLAVAAAGCMAADVVHILGRARQPLTGLDVQLTGERAQQDPHRLLRIRLEFRLQGDVAPAQLDRAIQLSRDKYCSVWHSLRDDIALDIVTVLRETTSR